MSTEAILAICTFGGSAVGTLGGIIISNKLTNFRLKQLEEKVNKHNNLVERMAVAENNICFLQTSVAELK